MIQEGDAVTTCVCWLFGKRPNIVQEKVITDSFILERAKILAEDPEKDQYLAFIAMAGLMTLGKEVREGTGGNKGYLGKRWKALCATIGIEDIISANVAAFVPPILKWQDWIKPRTKLRQMFIEWVVEPHEETNPLYRGVMDQVRLVLIEYGMKSVLMMEAFVAAHNRALELASVAVQTRDLRNKLKELRELHGAKFPFLKLVPLARADELHHRNYPDLYYAAISTAVHENALGAQGRFRMTEVSTTLSKTLIEEYADQTPKRGRGVDAKTKEILVEMGYPFSDDEDEAEDFIFSGKKY